MKRALLAAALLASSLVLAAPPAAPPAGSARAERAARAERMKDELDLTEAQSAALRNEAIRFRSAMRALRAEHRANVAKVLTPEQLEKAKGARRERLEERCEDLGGE